MFINKSKFDVNNIILLKQNLFLQKIVPNININFVSNH